MQELTGQATTASATSGEPARGMAPPGFRLPAATRLGRVRLQVAELERSLAYYQQVLGLRLISRTETDAALGAGGATGDDTPLVELHAHPGAAPLFLEWPAEHNGGAARFRSRSLRVALDEALLVALRDLLGADAVSLVKAR